MTEEKRYPELKESIRLMKIKKSDIERNKLIGDGKRMVID